MASDHDTLAELIDQHPTIPSRYAPQIADRVIAAGWRPPAREITDPDKLDALPGRSIVVGRNDEAWQLTSHEVVPHFAAYWGSPYLFSDRLSSRQLLGKVHAVTVLYVPTEEAGRG